MSGLPWSFRAAQPGRADRRRAFPDGRTQTGSRTQRRWRNALPAMVLAATCALPTMVYASTVKVLTIFADSGVRTLSVSNAPAGASYSVCLGLITGARQCDFKTGKVANDGTIAVEVPAGAGKAVANFSFAITVTNKDGSTSTENWRRIGDTGGERKDFNSETQKLNRLPDLQDPNGTRFASSSSFPFIVPNVGLFNEFQLTSSDTSTAYQVTSAQVYTGLDPIFFLPGTFDSPSAIATGRLALDLTDLLIPRAGDEADPSIALPVGPTTSGYELLIATLRPILDLDTGQFGSPITFAIASNASTAIAEPNGLLLLLAGALFGLCAAGRQRRKD